VRALPIDELKLPARQYNTLRREGVLTVGNLSDRTEAQLLAIEHVGPQTIKEIKQKLAERGLSLTGEPAAPAIPPGTQSPPIAAREPGTTIGAGEPAPAVAAGGPNPAIGAGEPTSALGEGEPGPEPSAAPTAPRAPRPPDEEAIDLLGVAGFPVLKRLVPVVAGAVLLTVLAVGLRRRLRRRSR
jgi:hypothetical protein